MHYTSSKQGSVLLFALLMTTAMAMVVGSLMRYGIAEKKMNEGHFEVLHAKNAAESMLEYGFSDLKTRFEWKTSFTTDELRVHPLEIPPSAVDFYADSGVQFDELELIGGNIGDPEIFFVSANDPANISDPQRGKYVMQREIAVFGKGVSEHPLLGKREAYAKQTLLVRDAFLFSHATFYNMDLEFHPGPQMEMNGPVHANGDIYVQAVNQLRFSGTLKAHGDIIYGYKQDGSITQTGSVDVNIGSDSSPDWVSFYDGSGSKTDPDNYFDSRMDNWRTEATNRWQGLVGSGDHDVPNLVPVGIDGYAPDDLATAAYDPYNPAYAMIEPVLPTDHANYKGDEVLEEQFSYKAGLVIEVEREENPDYNPNWDKDNPTDYDPRRYLYKEPRLYKYDRADASNPKSAPIPDSSDPTVLERLELKLPDGVVRIRHYVEADNGEPRSPSDPTILDDDTPEDSTAAPPLWTSYADGSSSYSARPDNVEEMGGFYDQRQRVGMDLVEIDVGELKTQVEAAEAAQGSAIPTDNPFYNAANSQTLHLAPGGTPGTGQVDWNGVLYVEVPSQTPSSDPDQVVPSSRDISLILRNGSQLPTPAFTRSSSIYDPGFTVATNAQLYVQGDYNADGINTGSDNDGNTTPDDGSSWTILSSDEVPAAVIADSVTILSNAWGDDHVRNSKKNKGNRDASHTEMSAAILTGQLPTVVGGDISMGVHNFPRFLEDWGGKRFLYRGSLVAMFESESGNGSTNGWSSWYAPPQRMWGFNEIFGKGYFPPGTPRVRDARLTQFEYLSAADYEDHLLKISGFNPLSDPRGHP